MVQVMSGRWCVPRSPDDRALSLPVHAEQLIPLLVQHFGQAWWRRGSVSLRGVSATLPGEPLRGYLEPLAGDRCRVWLNAEGEALIVRGTAALGEDRRSEVLTALARRPATASPQLLEAAEPGRRTSGTFRITAEQVDERLPMISEPMDCYRDPDALGARVAPPACWTGAAADVQTALARVSDDAQALPGALEIRHLEGPVLCDRDYDVEATLLAVTAAAGEETLWYQADVREPRAPADTDPAPPVARLLRMKRFGYPGP